MGTIFLVLMRKVLRVYVVRISWSVGPVRANFFLDLLLDYEAPRSKVGIFTKRLGQRSVYTRSAGTIVWKALMLHTDSGS